MIMNVEDPPEIICLGARPFLRGGEGLISLWSDADDKTQDRLTEEDMV